jgi:hypothetical protein
MSHRRGPAAKPGPGCDLTTDNASKVWPPKGLTDPRCDHGEPRFGHAGDAERRRKRSCMPNSPGNCCGEPVRSLLTYETSTTDAAAGLATALGDGNRSASSRRAQRPSHFIPACAADFLLTAWSGYPRPAEAIARHAPLTWRV